MIGARRIISNTTRNINVGSVIGKYEPKSNILVSFDSKVKKKRLKCGIEYTTFSWMGAKELEESKELKTTVLKINANF
jgi:hypothetical protein